MPITECQYCGRLFGQAEGEGLLGCSNFHQRLIRNGEKPTIEELKDMLRSLNEFSQRQAAELRRRSSREYCQARLKELGDD
jgi:hypothetical protein